MTSYRIEQGRHRNERCDRCGDAFEGGFTWPGLGIPVVLCQACTDDLEESVSSYGEDAYHARLRFFDRLRSIGVVQ